MFIHGLGEKFPQWSQHAGIPASTSFPHSQLKFSTPLATIPKYPNALTHASSFLIILVISIVVLKRSTTLRMPNSSVGSSLMNLMYPCVIITLSFPYLWLVSNCTLKSQMELFLSFANVISSQCSFTSFIISVQTIFLASTSDMLPLSWAFKYFIDFLCSWDSLQRAYTSFCKDKTSFSFSGFFCFI